MDRPARASHDLRQSWSVLWPAPAEGLPKVPSTAPKRGRGSAPSGYRLLSGEEPSGSGPLDHRPARIQELADRRGEALGVRLGRRQRQRDEAAPREVVPLVDHLEVEQL